MGEARDFVAGALRLRQADEAGVHRAVLLASGRDERALPGRRRPAAPAATARDAVIEVYDGTAVLPRKLRPTPDDEQGRGCSSSRHSPGAGHAAAAPRQFGW